MRTWIFMALFLAVGCGSEEPETETPTVLVAAAANLDRAIPQLVEAFETESDIQAVVSVGSTANLTQQIENGAPFDIFLSADTEHVDRLINGRFAEPGSRAIYARGRLALWTRDDSPIKLSDASILIDPRVRFISLANPAFAPYGVAAAEALTNLGYTDKLKDRVVYGQSISMAHQYAASGNADVAITALSLAIDTDGNRLELDSSLYRPIEQALVVLSNGPHQESAQDFAKFLSGQRGQEILSQFGYGAGD